MSGWDGMTRKQICDICNDTPEEDWAWRGWPPVIKCARCLSWNEADQACMNGVPDPGCGGWQFESRASLSADGGAE
jgi:hypothetical protein